MLLSSDQDLVLILAISLLEDKGRTFNIGQIFFLYHDSLRLDLIIYTVTLPYDFLINLLFLFLCLNYYYFLNFLYSNSVNFKFLLLFQSQILRQANGDLVLFNHRDVLDIDELGRIVQLFCISFLLLFLSLLLWLYIQFNVVGVLIKHIVALGACIFQNAPFLVVIVAA